MLYCICECVKKQSKQNIFGGNCKRRTGNWRGGDIRLFGHTAGFSKPSNFGGGADANVF